MQTSNGLTRGIDEKEGKEGVHQASDSRGQHGHPKSHRPDEVLGVAFPNLSQMCSQWIHQHAGGFFIQKNYMPFMKEFSSKVNALIAIK